MLWRTEFYNILLNRSISHIFLRKVLIILPFCGKLYYGILGIRSCYTDYIR